MMKLKAFFDKYININLLISLIVFNTTCKILNLYFYNHFKDNDNYNTMYLSFYENREFIILDISLTMLDICNCFKYFFLRKRIILLIFPIAFSILDFSIVFCLFSLLEHYGVSFLIYILYIILLRFGKLFNLIYIYYNTCDENIQTEAVIVNNEIPLPSYTDIIMEDNKYLPKYEDIFTM